MSKGFEEILTHVSESPKKVLKQKCSETQTLHQMLKNEFKRVPISFHLARL